MQILETGRLILRTWQDSDRAPFARMNADPRVMEFFPAQMSAEESNNSVDRASELFRERGFTIYAVELKQAGEFIGFVGLAVPRFEAHFTPCVEIGWRIAAEHWGCGYATEGARQVLRHAFHTLSLPAVVAMTVPANLRSRRVMEKLGMAHDPADDFDHPRMADGHPLKRHVLYRLKRP
jgi:RimJ/RimL family protein N-acetyltransferase